MDKEDVFGLFEGEDQNSPLTFSKNENKDIKDIKPYYIKIGMFTKIITNSIIFQNKLEEFLKEEDAFEKSPPRDTSYFKVFSQAWECIKNIDINQIDHLRALKKFNKKVLTGALQYSIWYFESQEEYMKCSHLYKIQNAIEERKK